MQQTKSYWRLVALAGLVSAFVGTACVVTTDDGSSGGSAGAAGASAGAPAGGSTAAGAGGAAAGTGGAAAGTGGATAGTGGGGVPFQCDPDDGMAVGTPNACPKTDDPDVCQACIAKSCCTAYANCFATAPGNQCGWGGPMDKGEIICALACIQDGASKAGGVVDDTLLGTCANQCATTVANGASKECMLPGSQTSELIGCMNDNCQVECYTG